MKKILFLIDNLKGGGAEKAIKIIVEGLQEKGYKAILVLLENKIDYKLNKNVEIYSLSEKINKFNFLFLLYQFNKLLKQIKPDIVYATNSKSQIISLLTTPFYKVKKIVNLQVDLSKQYENRKYILFVLIQLFKLCDGYSFISKGIYENVKNYLPKKETFFIPNPIDFNEIDKLKIEKIEDKYLSIFQKKVYINIGRLTKQKGQWILIEAFAKLNEDAHLVILGTGEMENELKILAENLGIENRVFFLGFHKNPFKFLYNSDVFVLSSLWEGFGNVIVEAMRCELPVISTNCPSGPSEILDNGKYGVLIPVNNVLSLIEAMKNIDITQFKQLSIQRANNYQKYKIVDMLIEKLLRT